MESAEVAEIKMRAEIISASAIEFLQDNLKALHRRNAAKGVLRSGATVKESASVARETTKFYFHQLQQFALARPDGRSDFDATIVDSVAGSTAQLIASINDGLVNTATLAGDPSLVRAIEERSNWRAISISRNFPIQYSSPLGQPLLRKFANGHRQSTYRH